MRGPLLNMSPGLGASGVDMEYRRSSQGISKLSKQSIDLRSRACPCTVTLSYGRIPRLKVNDTVFLFQQQTSYP